MKSLILSLIAILSVTTLFSQQNSKRSCEINAPKSICTNYDLNDSSVTLSWGEINNTLSNYSKTEVRSIEHGLIKTTNDITIRSTNVSKVFFYDHFYLLIYSSCSNSFSSSDTIQTFTLSLTNPADGTAVLRWTEKKKCIKLYH